MVSAHGIDEATMPVGAPECWGEGVGVGQVGDGFIQLADLHVG